MRWRSPRSESRRTNLHRRIPGSLHEVSPMNVPHRPKTTTLDALRSTYETGHILATTHISPAMQRRQSRLFL
ncbi:uncharacterized protein MYCFIDRAFT_211719 [Pseudocercospora fijiensis CIRAD86]|uniref:Uncharacterized protein n=1 Tax=Pseudocercospora fijiensis (strain CIRAD86) TaxID=383855 RepID=M2YTA6_PSEFD|nr:uncharacterized protein MYCFIDRAFT_211719 [Pseudocercospora fijiensis CIRAD86]EME80985.1 hypothetical protein MYCFIDRAFT_211719 [Pseudocercospora fijiensis CIRAD86]